MRASRFRSLISVIAAVGVIAAAGVARAQLDQPLPPPSAPAPAAPKLTKPPAIAKDAEPLDQVPVDMATGRHRVTVWVVVRDDRGGESWVQGLLALD